MKSHFHAIRSQYKKNELSEDQIARDPLDQLERWLMEAINYECPEPTAMVLSTTGPDLRPSSRVVLMKDLTPQGITFFTNYDSRKGEQLRENPMASLLFFWSALERQVRIEGVVSKVGTEESDEYFYSRPLPSRISASVSPQSQPIPGRDWLQNQWTQLSEQVLPASGAKDLPTGHEKVQRPQNWGGYRLVPDYFEFWQGRENRLHDRLTFRRTTSGWILTRLAP